jgi:pimeloyl-ACP methyl ester carboxylesterase
LFIMHPLPEPEPFVPEWFQAAIAAPKQMSSFDVNGCTLEVMQWANEGRPGLLLMHGNSAHAHWYSYLGPLLARDFNVVAFSFSGMGGSGWREGYSNDQWADEALAVAETCGLMRDGQKPVFLAHSFGGFALMNACARFGERLAAAIIADTPLRTREQQSRRLDERPRRAFKPHRVYASLDEAVSRFRLMPAQSCAHPFILEHIARTSLKPVLADHGEAGGWTWKFDPFLFQRFDMGKPGKDLLESRCPVTWLNGARSSLIDEAVRQNIETFSPLGTQVVTLDDANHHLMIDQPLAFVETVRRLVFARQR